MKMNELREIVEIIEKANIDVLKLEKGDFKLYYQKNGVQGVQINEIESMDDTPLEVKSTQSASEHTKEENDDGNLHQITSPMIGAFYARPNPDSEPFVQVGTKINKQDTVCVLEAMKLLNEVKSDVDGEIVEILVEDEQIIEFGQPLFTVKVSE